MESIEKVPAAAKGSKIGDTYDPNMLPDHRGPYFNHKISKLVQCNYQDLDGSLIAPHELYTKLTEGTLFSAQITLNTYIFSGCPPNKIYHIYVEKLKIHDPGYGEGWKPSIPTIPATSSSIPSMPQRRGRPDRDEDADNAFSVFDSVSPPKRKNN
ncbi:hypothetical protein FB451DRAFT_1396242 [Mycena latifolia]|nr:hypothetical protein FB451DRAFT_1396242 [Mycena latifolia]